MAATYSVIWSAVMTAASGNVAVGTCVLDNGSGQYVVATTANRGTKRVGGITRTAASASVTSVEVQTYGPVPASVTGLAAGTAGPVRVSSTGALERVTAANCSDGDEVVGWAEADGSAHVFFGGAGFVTDVGPERSTYARLETTDANAATLYTATPESGTSEDWLVTAIGRRTSNGDTYRADIVGCYENTGGTTTLIGSSPAASNVRNSAGASGWSVGLDISSNAVRVRVTGGAYDVEWRAVVSRIITRASA